MKLLPKIFKIVNVYDDSNTKAINKKDIKKEEKTKWQGTFGQLVSGD